MKLLIISLLFFASNITFAESNVDLVKRGCIPRRDSAAGEIKDYDCNIKKNSGNFEQLGKPKKTQLRKIEVNKK